MGLLVIGPKRLPEALRTGAMWLGRVKRTVTNVRRDLENEIGIDEIRQDLRNEQIMAELKADNLADEQERRAKEQAKRDAPHGNTYLDSAYKHANQSSEAKQTDTEQIKPSSKDSH